jgi:hypothetical protein
MTSKQSTVRSLIAASAVSLGFAVWACGGNSGKTASDNPGDDGSGGVGQGGASGASSKGGSANGATAGTSTVIGGTGGGAGSSNAGAAGTTTIAPTQCNNGLDDDGDGFIDGFDPECTGPLDNDEGSFSTGIPGDNRDPKWQDCFFDGNSGAGDDHCRYSTDCLTGALSQDDPDCAITEQCRNFCARLTPNGCDCFGCCTVRDVDGSEVDVTLGGTCSVATIQDADICHPCTKTMDCGNTCGECELCPGKTINDLPAHCSDTPDGGTDGGEGGAPGDAGVPPPPNTCDNGEQVCSADIPCPNNYYCSLGCCLPIVR